MERTTSYDDTGLDPVRRQILRLIGEKRSNLRMASLAIGRNAAYLHQFIHRGTPRILAEDDREALARHLDCSPEEIKHGRPPNGEARPQPASADPHAVPAGYSAVPELDVRAGAWNDGVEQTRATWLLADPLIRHEFRAKPENLRMITVDGDSMDPLFSSGDRILIDVSRQVPVPPGIFVIWDGMGLVTKRLEHVPHSEPARVVITSANPEYASYERLVDEIRIVGRAVWFSRRL